VTTAEPDASARNPERLPGLRPKTDGDSSEQVVRPLRSV
jgi:hypothetical protein